MRPPYFVYRVFMMKKAFIVLAIISAVLCLTACSEDFTSGLGDVMGKMGNNVYGIKADLRTAEAGAATVSSSISKNEQGEISIDYAKAASISDSIGEIRESPQKANALRQMLSEEVPAEDVAAVRTALDSEMGRLKNSLQSAVVETPQLVAVKTSLLSALTRSEEIESDSTPVMADVVMVALMGRMAEAVASGDTHPGILTEIGKTAVETIKVVAEISSLDILADVNVSGLVSDMTGRDISEEEDETLNPLLGNLVGKSMTKVVSLISSGAKLDPGKYEKFIIQSWALIAAYEMTCAAYVPEETSLVSDFFAVAGTDVDEGLTIEDLVLYLVLKINNALETYSGGIWGNLLSVYIFEENNYAIFSDFENATSKPTLPGNLLGTLIAKIVGFNDLSDEEDDSVFMELGNTLANEIMDDSGDFDFEDAMDTTLSGITGDSEFGFLDMLSDFGNIMNGVTEGIKESVVRFTRGLRTTIMTTAVMIKDSEYDVLFTILEGLLGPMMIAGDSTAE